MRKVIALLILLFALVASSAHAWTVTNHWTPATMGDWYTWDSYGTAASNITLSPAQPDGYTTTLRITTPSGTSSNSGFQIAGASCPFSTQNEMWTQYYVYYPAAYTFHPIAEKISGWEWNPSDGNMLLVWQYGQLVMDPQNGWQYFEATPNAGYDPTMQTGHWYKFVEHVVINTAGSSNGVYQLWVDDRMVMNYSNVPYRSSGQTSGWTKFKQLLVWGGQGGDVTLGADMHQYRGTTILSTSAIVAGSDTSAPYVSGRLPDSGDTNISTTTRTITAHVVDYGNGVSLSSIRMAVGKNGGAKTEWTCASGLTCSGTSSDYTVTRTMTTDWTAGDTVQVVIFASDLSSPSNVMPWDAYSYTIVFPSGGPYPQSSLISSVNWDFASEIDGAPGSDLWPMTWAGDNNVYTSWGDGGGYGGTNTVCRTVFGVGKITGDPPSGLGWTNIYGCKADGSGCDTGATHDAACDTSYASAFNVYGDDILAVDNTLYSIQTLNGFPNPQGAYPTKIAYSSNFGQSWSQFPFTWPGLVGDWKPTGFVHKNKGYTGEDYIYIIGQKNGDRNHTYLARYPLPIHRCGTGTGGQPSDCLGYDYAYQWFTGTTAVPAWGAWANAVPIHTDSGQGNGGHMTHFTALGLYILTQAHGGSTILGEVQKLAMYESPNPWGPWSVISYYSTWGSLGTSLGLWYSIPPKWISADGKTFWMSYSGGSDGSINQDALHLIKGTFTLSGGAPPTAPGAGTSFFGPYFYGIMY